MEVLDLLFCLGEASAKSLEDEEITFSDAAYFIDVVTRVAPAIEDVGAIHDEIKSWSEDDTDAVKVMAEKFDIPQENLEEVIEKSIKLAADLVELFAKFRSE